MFQITKQTLLPLLKKYLPHNPVIIEAGAFNGSDTQRLSAFWSDATIHAFEPVPDIFQQLQEATQQLANVHCYPLALSGSSGTATFYVSQHPDRPDKPFQAGSLLAPKERLQHSPAIYPTTIDVATITIDDWAAQHDINHIDMLWLDMQGNELAALKAAPRMLATVHVIYTEVEFIEAYEGQPLYPHVKAWLEGQGFTMIARDFTDNPTWFFGNALFIKDKF